MERGETNILCWRQCSGGYDDVDEEMNVNEANFLVSEASKLSAGARIVRAPSGPEILVF